MILVAEADGLHRPCGFVGNAAGVEGGQLVDEVSRFLIYPHALMKNRFLFLIEKRRFTTQMDAAEHGVDHAGRDLIEGELHAGHRPYATLFGKHARGGRRRDLYEEAIFPRVGEGLQGVMLKLTVVHSHTATGAVFYDEVGIFCLKLVDPRNESEPVFVKTVAVAVGIPLGADAYIDVVVEFEIGKTVIADEAIDKGGQMGADLPVSHIELIAVALHDANAVTGEEAIIVKLLCGLVGGADVLGLYPKTRAHALGADIIKHLAEALRKSFGGLLVGADGAPPAALVGIPARVDAENLAACRGGGIDLGQELCCGRVGVEATHIIVKDNGMMAVRRYAPGDPATVGGHFGEGVIKILAQGDRRLYTLKALSGLQVFPPVVLAFRGARKAQVEE